MTVTANNAAMLGYAVRVINATDGYEYSAIKIKPRTDGFDGAWNATTAAAVLRDGTGKVELGGRDVSSCRCTRGRPSGVPGDLANNELIAL